VIEKFLYHATVVRRYMLVARFNMKVIVNLKARLVEKFSMRDLGSVKKILGIKISLEKRGC